MNRWKELEDDTKKEEFIEQCKTSVNRRLLVSLTAFVLLNYPCVESHSKYVKILQPWADGHREKHKKIFKRRRLGAYVGSTAYQTTATLLIARRIKERLRDETWSEDFDRLSGEDEWKFQSLDVVDNTTILSEQGEGFQ